MSEAKKVVVEMVEPITLEKSFDIVNNRLERLRKDMLNSDIEVYRAVGEFADSTATIAQNMVDIALSCEESEVETVVRIVSKKDLHKRFELLRVEADQLLLAAYTNEELERALKLEQFLDRISNRIQSLACDQELNLQALSMSKLKAMARGRNLKGYSRMNKSELIDFLYR